ncbi:hypothetical protein OQA88_13507 [Cercophora sp. LCS_1]
MDEVLTMLMYDEDEGDHAKYEDGPQVLRHLLKFPKTQLATEGDDKATIFLAQSVGGLPLGIRIMAGFMNDMEGDTASEFMKLYIEDPRELMMQAGATPGYDKDIARSEGEEHPLDRVWTISFGSLKPQSRTLLGIMSFLNPDQIPQYLFDVAALSGKPANCADLSLLKGRVKLKGATTGLTIPALIDEISKGVFSIHRIVQEAIRYWCNGDEAYKYFTAAVHVVYEHFPRQVSGRPMPGNWDKCQDLIQHDQILAERFEELQNRFPKLEAPAELFELLKSCGWYLFEMADHPPAIQLLDKALKTCADE